MDTIFDWLSGVVENPFYEFSIILILAVVLGVLGQFLRQPLIVMFIALGVICGPSVLDIVKSKENIHLLAEIGIAILLFIVGLKLDVRIIRSVGKIALMTGLGQVLFTSFIGYFIGILLGFTSMHSFYIAVALTFSSTIIIVKLLSDKKEIDSLHGQISIGFLIVQDILVILTMIILSAIRKGGEESLQKDIVATLISGTLLVLFTMVSMKWILPGLTRRLARSQELLTLFAVGWAVGMAMAGELMGFSGEVGAFLAGISLASSDFKEVISGRLVSLRDFLLLFFFVHLGAELNLSLIGAQVNSAILFSLFVLIGNPLIVMVIMGVMGYRKRTSFLAGLTVAQISEFSLIFAGLGLSIGHITEEVVGLITLVGLITIALSTYLILYSSEIYTIIKPVLRIFERKIPHPEDQQLSYNVPHYDVVIIGLGRYGSKLAELIEENSELSYLGIDFDPAVVQRWQESGKNIIYGDIEDPELFEFVPFNQSSIIISAIPDYLHNKHLMKMLSRQSFQGKVYLTASTEEEFQILETCGAQEVVMPHKMAAINFFNRNIDPLRDKTLKAE